MWLRSGEHDTGRVVIFCPSDAALPPTGPLCCTCPGCAPASGPLLGHLGTGYRVPVPGVCGSGGFLPECVCTAVHGCCHGSPQHSVLRSRSGREPRCVHGPSEKGRARPKPRPPASTNRYFRAFVVDLEPFLIAFLIIIDQFCSFWRTFERLCVCFRSPFDLRG